LLFYLASCSALFKIKLGYVYVIGPFHLHTCKLIKSMSLSVVDLLIASFRFTAYICGTPDFTRTVFTPFQNFVTLNSVRIHPLV